MRPATNIVIKYYSSVELKMRWPWQRDRFPFPRSVSEFSGSAQHQKGNKDVLGEQRHDQRLLHVDRRHRAAGRAGVRHRAGQRQPRQHDISFDFGIVADFGVALHTAESRTTPRSRNQPSHAEKGRQVEFVNFFTNSGIVEIANCGKAGAENKK